MKPDNLNPTPMETARIIEWRNAALEEAAKIAESYISLSGVAQSIAANIRELKEYP